VSVLCSTYAPIAVVQPVSVNTASHADAARPCSTALSNHTAQLQLHVQQCTYNHCNTHHCSVALLTLLYANVCLTLHCTITGGISRFHLEPGGDITWNVGTGYFGCRDEHGQFSPEKFTANATRPQVTPNTSYKHMHTWTYLEIVTQQNSDTIACTRQ
jgi:hypothetical protein